MKTNSRRALLFAKCVNWVTILLVAVWLGFGPAAITIWGVTDPALRTGDTPRFATWAHRKLAPRMEHWAEERYAARTAEKTPPNSIAGEEWPLFSCAFYTWAAQEILRAHQGSPDNNPVDPRSYTADSLQAMVQLALDPDEAGWVREMWGEENLFNENAYYRMCVLTCLAAHAELTGSSEHHAIMRAWADDLADDIDRSKTGLLRDYPPECYPGDVLAGINAIRDADQVLGIERPAFYARALRGFSGDALHPLGIPPFEAWLCDTVSPGSFRGSSNAYVTIFGPKLWPKESAAWFRAFDAHLWHETHGLAGFREFLPDEGERHWGYFDVDAGPILAGFGMSATAYGVGAARVNGRFDRAYPLSAEMIAASWPLPNGTLLLPHVLSQAVHAPYLGESAIVFNLVQRPAYCDITPATAGMPPLVYGILAMYVGTALLFCVAVLRDVRRWRAARYRVRLHRTQLTAWVLLWGGGIGLCLAGYTAGYALIALAVLVPRTPRPAKRCSKKISVGAVTTQESVESHAQ